MLRTYRMLAPALALLALVPLACGRAADRTGRPLVERGAYLVQVAGCQDCHTPLRLGATGPEPDPGRMLSGHPSDQVVVAPERLPEGWAWAGSASNTAFAGPWGVSFATNLTPDLETGLGVYTEETFLRALRTGKHLGAGRPILPPMPWMACRHMTDEDLRAIFAYLKTVPAIRNPVPPVLPPAS